MGLWGKKNLKKTEKTPYEQLQEMIIKTPSISLKVGEVCFYQEKATALHQKNVVTGTKSAGAGVNVKLAKGVSIRTGGSGSENIRGTVNEYFDGTLYITNMRVVLLAPKHGFDTPITKITSISKFNNGLLFYVKAKGYSVMTDDSDNIIALINLMNMAFENQEKESTGKSKNAPANGTAKELREYKKLLDDGIITEAEFDAKKKQLLGL